MGQVLAAAAVFIVEQGLSLIIDNNSKPKGTHPHPDDIRMQTSEYATAIPVLFGTQTIGGNIIWCDGPSFDGVHNIITFAVAICAGPISHVSKITFDGKEVNVLDHCVSYTVHLGTETETVDPIIEAVEAVGNTPAFRGLAYVVFESLNTDDYNQSIPTINFTTTGAGSEIEDNRLIAPTTTIKYDGHIAINPANTHALIRDKDGKLAKIRLNYGEVEATGFAYGRAYCNYDFDSDGTIYSVEQDPRSGSGGVYRYVKRDKDTLDVIGYSENCSFLEANVPSDLRVNQGAHVIVCISDQRSKLLFFPVGSFTSGTPHNVSAGSGYWWRSITELNAAQNDLTYSFSTIALKIKQDLSIARLYYFKPDGSAPYHVYDNITSHMVTSTQLQIHMTAEIKWTDSTHQQHMPNVDGSSCSIRIVTGCISSGSPHIDTWDLFVTKELRHMYPPYDYYGGTVLRWVGYLVDKSLETYDSGIFVNSHDGIWKRGPYQDTMFLPSTTESKLYRVDLSVPVESEQQPSYPVVVYSGQSTYDHDVIGATRTPAIIGGGVSGSYDGWWRVPVLPGILGPTTPELITRGICSMVGIDSSAELDISDISTPEVQGYLVNDRMSAQSAIQPLLDCFVFDSYENELGSLVIRKRITSPVVSIPESDLGASDGSSDAQVKFSWDKTCDTELPQECDLSHLDPDLNFDKSVSRFQYANTDSKDLLAIDVPFSISWVDGINASTSRVLDARQSGDKYIVLLPRKYAILDRTDFFSVVVGTETYYMRAEQVNYKGGVIQISAVGQDL